MAGERDIRICGCVPVEYHKEGNMFVAYCSALDLCNCGETYEEAQRNFADAFEVFWSECKEHGTLLQVAASLGWRVKLKNQVYLISPPHYVGTQQVVLEELTHS